MRVFTALSNKRHYLDSVSSVHRFCVEYQLLRFCGSGTGTARPAAGLAIDCYPAGYRTSKSIEYAARVLPGRDSVYIWGQSEICVDPKTNVDEEVYTVDCQMVDDNDQLPARCR